MSKLHKTLYEQVTAVRTRCPANPSPRILVVEDDSVIRQLTTRVLARVGYQVNAAEDGEVGWQALQVEPYDLLLIDNSMPKITGLELVQKMRSARMTLPVILTTGILPTEELNRNPQLQLAATLLKPFTVEQLLTSVKEALWAADSTLGQAETNFPAPVDTCRLIGPRA